MMISISNNATHKRLNNTKVRSPPEGSSVLNRRSALSTIAGGFPWPITESKTIFNGHGCSNVAPEVTTTNTIPSNSPRSEEHTSELQSRLHLVCRLLLEKKT